MASEPRPLLVCDAGPLIHLDEIGSLDLLTQFDEVLVPIAVWEEVAAHRPAALSSQVSLTLIDEVPVHSRVLKTLAVNSALDLGELQALQLMEDRPSAVLLSDDTAARRMARALKRSFTGTLGLITLSIKTGKRTKAQAIALLKTLPQKSTLHVRKALLQSLIEELEEGKT